MKKILIVDDDQGTIRLIEMVLTKAGYKLISLQDSTQTLDLIRKELPDLVILDYMMPGLDGVTLSGMLQADPALSRIPVMFFTALGDIKTKTAAFSFGVRDYITKPVHPQELLLRIKNLIG